MIVKLKTRESGIDIGIMRFRLGCLDLSGLLSGGSARFGGFHSSDRTSKFPEPVVNVGVLDFGLECKGGRHIGID